MGTTANLHNEVRQVITGKDSIVIVKVIDTIRGGVTLDVTDFLPDVINAGHVIIMETATKKYKPMPVVGTGAIGSLGAIVAGASYTNGTYSGVALTGGSGSGATANITVSGGAVTAVTVVNKGAGYKAGDILSASTANIGGGEGAGFAVAVSSVEGNATAYGTLPGGHEYAGILIASVLTEKPFASVMLRGTVNPAAAPFAMTSILSAVETACPHILFKED